MNVDLTLPAKSDDQGYETIQEHTDNVVEVGFIILENFSSELERLCSDVGDSIPFESSSPSLSDFILNLLRFHDYGKVNPYFTEHIQGSFRETRERKHSLYSYLLWLCNENPKLDDVDEGIFDFKNAVSFSVIVGHHGSLKKWEKDSDNILGNSFSYHIKNLYDWGMLNEEEEEHLNELISILLERNVPVSDSSSLTLSKFIFSVLCISDSIASSDIQKEDYSIAVDDLLGKDIQSTDVLEMITNSDISKMVDKSKLSSTDEFSNCKEMNDVRILLNKKASAAWDKDVDIYILEAPVGTGKTMSSLSLANEIVKMEKKKKIISTFPLNSVQGQYQKNMEEDIGIKEEHMNVINSESLFKVDFEFEKEEKNKDNPENQIKISDSNLWLFERNCFSNEFLITSHVRFFETLTSITRKSSLGYLSLFNSVVVIDEFQNYPKEYWESIWSELLRMSRLFGVKWIFTTGTFPVSNSQLTSLYGEKIKYVLSDKDNTELFNHSSVKGRSDIKKLSDEVYDDAESIGHDIVESIQNQEESDFTQYIVCVSLVNTARKLYDIVSNELKDYEIQFLCGRHSNSYKKAMVEKVTQINQDRSKKFILVTTKTVECGMDFDFDYGFKEFDMFDSVEQLSGRVNRSKKRDKGWVEVFLFDRYKMEKEKLYDRTDESLDLLRDKNFRKLFENMYKENKLELSQKEEELIQLNKTLNYEEYKKRMTIIEDDGYITDIYFVKSMNVDNFLKKVRSFETTGTFSDKIQQSIKLREKLEPFRMKVTTKWLKRQVDDTLIQQEVNGIVYFLLGDDEKFEEIVEVDEVLGISSYVEKMKEVSKR